MPWLQASGYYCVALLPKCIHIQSLHRHSSRAYKQTLQLPGLDLIATVHPTGCNNAPASGSGSGSGDALAVAQRASVSAVGTSTSGASGGGGGGGLDMFVAARGSGSLVRLVPVPWEEQARALAAVHDYQARGCRVSSAVGRSRLIFV